MKVLANVLEESTIESLLGVVDNFLSGNSAGHKVWTNLAWDPRLVLGSNTVICLAVPDSLILEIEKSLIESDLLDESKHKMLSETKTVMLYLWPNGSYISPHKDGSHAKAISIYLNKEWSLSDGGLFCYVDTQGIHCVSPEYNLSVENDEAKEHFTTPVTSSKLRISLQIFASYR